MTEGTMKAGRGFVKEEPFETKDKKFRVFWRRRETIPTGRHGGASQRVAELEREAEEQRTMKKLSQILKDISPEELGKKADLGIQMMGTLIEKMDEVVMELKRISGKDWDGEEDDEWEDGGIPVTGPVGGITINPRKVMKEEPSGLEDFVSEGVEVGVIGVVDGEEGK